MHKHANKLYIGISISTVVIIVGLIWHTATKVNTYDNQIVDHEKRIVKIERNAQQLDTMLTILHDLQRR